MLSLFAGWRVSLQRMRSDWPIVAAAWLITLLAASLLAAGPIYSDAVSLAGMRRVLADAPTRSANIEATALLAPAEVPVADDLVSGELARALSGVDYETVRSARSETYALPEQPGDEVSDLAVLGFNDRIAEHATLLDGDWPRTAPASAVEVAVLDAVAAERGWRAGDELQLTSRRDSSRAVTVVIAGVYAIDDASHPFWWDDPQATEGVTQSDRYRTYGPLLATPQDLLGRVAASDVRISWRAYPRFEELTLDRIGPMRARLAELPDRLGFALAGSFPTVATQLDDLLGDAERSLLVSRTGVLLLIVQLGVLAAYAIILTAGLLADHRRGDTALLRSRGAGPVQVASMAMVEALVLAAPAALAAPLVAVGALRLLNLAGPLAEIDLAIQPAVSALSVGVAGAAALAAALLLVVPPFLSARSFVDEQGARSRFATRTIGQRLGLDLALLAVTLVAFWQLRLYGAPLTRSVQGTLGLDPLLVAAPAIGLLAGGVLALRVIPLLASLAESVTSRGRRLVSALGAQQVARRPLRYTRAALLLMLAISMGVFAISYAETWRTSQEDQAAFQVGADVRLQTAGAGASVPDWALSDGLGRLPGVERLMPVERRSIRISASARDGQLLAVDAGAASAIVPLRGDLAGASLDALLRPLGEERPQPRLLELGEAPQRVRVEAEVTLEEISVLGFDEEEQEFHFVPAPPGYLDEASVVGAELVVRDAAGVVQRFTAEPVPLGSGRQQVIVELSARSPRAAITVSRLEAGFAPPVELLGVDLTLRLPPGSRAADGRIRLAGIAVSDAAEGDEWRALDVDAAGNWSLYLLRNNGPRAPVPRAQAATRSLVLGTPGETGQIYAPDPGMRPPAVGFVPSSVAELANAAMPVLVNSAFLNATSTRVGDVLGVRLDNATRQLRIAGSLRSFPTTDPNQPLVVADLATLSLLRYGSTQGSGSVDEWWLATVPEAEEGVAERVAEALPVARVFTFPERASTLSADPVALGIIGALSLGFVVAGLFAIIGLAVSAAVSARQRRTEFALLRALGLSARQLSTWLWLENAGLVAVSLLAGTLLGLLIGWVALPFITVTQQGAPPFPPPLVRTPWDGIGLLLGICAVALTLTVVVLGRVLRRFGIGSVLRMGED